MTVFEKDLDENVVRELEILYNDMTAHKELLATVVASDMSVDVTESKLYANFIAKRKEYNLLASKIITEATENKYGADCSWTIDFNSKKLRINKEG